MKVPILSDTIDYSLLPPKWARIIIDGDNGSGKTTMAKEMAQILKATVVSIDDHLMENGAVYWEQIQYEALRSKILTGGPKVIIEGVCLLKVLANIGITHDYHIFRRLFNGNLGWEYEYYLNEKVKLPHSSLRREIVRYYREYRPFDTCDVILGRFV